MGKLVVQIPRAACEIWQGVPRESKTMPLTNYPRGVTSFGVPVFGSLGIGNVYFISRTASAAQAALFSKRYVNTKFDDGTKMLWPDAGDGAQMQAAITASQGGFNNYFIVAPGNYNLTAAITLAGKSNSHLIACNQGDYGVGALGSSALTQTGSVVGVIMEAYGELTGFQIINKNGYAAVSVPNNIWRPTVHHNYFHMVGGSDINLIDASGAAACVSGSIHHNKFSTWVGGVLNSAIYVGTGTAVSVSYNEIVALTTAMVLDYGIFNNSVGGMTNDNYVSEGGGNGLATYGGTITVAIQTHASGTAINNRTAVGTGQGLAGGTASHSMVDNRDGQAGGAAAIET